MLQWLSGRALSRYSWEARIQLPPGAITFIHVKYFYEKHLYQISIIVSCAEIQADLVPANAQNNHKIYYTQYNHKMMVSPSVSCDLCVCGARAQSAEQRAASAVYHNHTNCRRRCNRANCSAHRSHRKPFSTLWKWAKGREQRAPTATVSRGHPAYLHRLYAPRPPQIVASMYHLHCNTNKYLQ